MDNNVISGYRAQIDALDAELLSLLNRRAGIACEVAQLKQQSGMPIVDPQREHAILARLREKNAGPFDSASIARIFRCIIEESRRIEFHRTACRCSERGLEGSREGMHLAD